MYNEQTEKIVLANSIMYPSSLLQVLEFLSEPDFYIDKHRLIFSTIKTLNQSNITITTSTIISYFNDNKIDLISYLLDLLDSRTTGNIKLYIDDLIDYSSRRKLSKLIQDTNQLIQDKNYSLDKACFDIDNQIKAINSISTNSLIAMKDMATGRIEDVAESKKFYKTGFRDLDSAIHGIFCGELIILAARPKSGKTAMAGNITCNIAENHPGHILFMSLEMKRNQLRRRFISSYAGIDSFVLKTGNFENEDQKIRAEVAMTKVDALPIYISDSVFELEGIINTVKRFASLKKIDLVVIDYIQLVNNYIKGASREQMVSEIGRNFKIMAADLNIPVLALSQLSRAVEARPDGKPILSDLRESGALEQHADMVWFIYQDKKALEKHDIDDTQYQLDVAANRDGKAGFEVDLTFHKIYTKFTNFMEV